MPGLIKKLTALASSPQAKAGIEKARQQAAKPENRQRIEDLRTRLGRRRS